ncbi:fused response regulator/phosphatase [Psychrobium sp. 1_MG-2023]|uniref:fused response regulator/phosphatase n=1 Tax=Psychrobium sp. 1_MG-2023 TaxID=3062624 RepID=UPI002733C29A|nr:fused response regulator/phosphatase [Psychrobium sp. 1_MG-2023]MDP2560155.1 fused response regulator/phosphatase [Psychrobium sp. 1_MG-2023]
MKTGIESQVLIIDSNPDQLERLAKAVNDEGFKTILSHDGMQGMVKFYQERPDLVLIDYHAIGMNAIDSCRQIKALAADVFVPVVIISDYLDEKQISECVAAGADDIIFKPFSLAIFCSKIYAMFRIADLYRELHSLTSERQNDEELAEQLFSDVVEKGNVAKEHIKIFKRSAKTFSGDVQLTALCPSGDVNVLLGDFTGHGLSSAIGAIPLADIFRAMTDKGHAPLEIIRQINRKMHQLLPTHMFLALSMVTLSVSEKVAYVWNAGMEDVLAFNGGTGTLKHRVKSFHPPLGISNQLLHEMKPKIIPLEANDRILLYSDGIVEARNRAGDFFGEARLIDSTKQGFINRDVTGHIIAAVEVFCEDLPQDDDISLVDINCDLSHYQSLSPVRSRELDFSVVEDDLSKQSGSWGWQMSLSGDKLSAVDPIPIIINQLQEIEGQGEHWHSLFTVLTELFVNALDHGVLALSSDLKSSPEGFAHYFSEKQKRLKEVDKGFIKIKLEHSPTENGGLLTIVIKDSGGGFDFESWLTTAAQQSPISSALSGRGIQLVQELCEHLTYLDNGSTVKAVYCWSRDR